MELTLAEEAGVRFVEGQPDTELMRSTEDATLLVEACFAHGVSSALLYAPNLTEKFFDLRLWRGRRHPAKAGELLHPAGGGVPSRQCPI